MSPHRSIAATLAIIALLACTVPIDASRPVITRQLLQQFPDVPGFATLVNQDSVGNDIAFRSVSSAQECANICNSYSVSTRALASAAPGGRGEDCVRMVAATAATYATGC